MKEAFDTLKKRDSQAVIFAPGGFLYQRRAMIAKLAIEARLPTCGWSRETLEAGMLISYGPDQRAIIRRTATYVDKILKGAKPAELPVEAPTRFEFLINLNTAKVLGLAVPASLLSLADELI